MHFGCSSACAALAIGAESMLRTASLLTDMWLSE